MTPDQLIQTANRIIGRRTASRPPQSDLRRAISTAYYAMFHALCFNVADCLIGKTKAHRSEPAWRQAYRAVDHRFAKRQCANQGMMRRFPEPIRVFAEAFVQLQEKRHAADYDPHASFRLADARMAIETARTAIRALNGAGVKDRRAFAAWTVMKTRN